MGKYQNYLDEAAKDHTFLESFPEWHLFQKEKQFKKVYRQEKPLWETDLVHVIELDEAEIEELLGLIKQWRLAKDHTTANDTLQVINAYFK